MSREFDAETRRNRAFDLMSGIWRYMVAFEEGDPDVVAVAAPDLRDLQGRIDRLLGRNSKDMAA